MICLNLSVMIFWLLVLAKLAMCPPVLDGDVFDRGAKVDTQFKNAAMVHCTMYSHLPSTVASGIEVDLSKCEQMITCLSEHQDKLISGTDHIAMFECAQNIWPQQFTALDLQSIYLPYDRIKNVFSKDTAKAAKLPEPKFYSTLRTPPLGGPYPALITELDAMYKQGQIARDPSLKETKGFSKAYPTGGLSLIPTSMGDKCYTHYMLPNLFQEEQFEPMLERTWNCRKFMICLEKHLVTVATQPYLLEQRGQFYDCARQSLHQRYRFSTYPFLKKKQQ